MKIHMCTLILPKPFVRTFLRNSKPVKVKIRVSLYHYFEEKNIANIIHALDTSKLDYTGMIFRKPKKYQQMQNTAI